MVFPTLQFVLFFALVLAVDAALGRRAGARKAFLIAASYVFYAAWDARFALLMAFATAVAWAAGLAVHHSRHGRAARVAAIVLLIGTLAVFKYFNFFLLSLQQLLGTWGLARDWGWMRLILPVGISFYVFQAVSYVMDVARGAILPRRSPADVALYISFFPQLVAGPIVRAADFLPQIDRPLPVDAAMRAEAVALILAGLVKKMVVANYLAVGLVDPAFAFPAAQSGLTMATATLAYAVQIYCDFSGYSDIAIGLALLLGYRFARNFDQPYRAASLREFWRRWHISLSTWIRDYLYIPLGGNRGGGVRRGVVLLATMTLAGLWHGAGWTFLLWGAAHGAGLWAERRIAPARALPAPLAAGLVLAFVCLLWIPFRSPDLATAGAALAALARAEGSAPVALAAPLLVLVAAGLAMNWLPLAWRRPLVVALAAAPSALQAGVLALGTLVVFAAAQEGVAPFIYFQF
ncbi:MAG: MBOAT family protein [Rhodobacteraceae bacterium]|nr:MBOAT family protein [Paracoccaceae bacterium]